MKLKYYMRGIGVGIVFTVLIFFATQPETAWSEAKIIEEAKKLGMVESTKDGVIWNVPKTTPVVDPALTPAVDPSDQLTSIPSEETSDNQNITPEPTDTMSDVQSSPEPTDTMSNMQSSPEPTDMMSNIQSSPQPTISPTTEPTRSPTKAPTIEPTTSPTKGTTDVVTIRINQGMTSAQVATLLMEKGLIESAEDFDEYLIEHGYAFNISEGAYIIKKNATYYDIAKKITR